MLRTKFFCRISLDVSDFVETEETEAPEKAEVSLTVKEDQGVSEAPRFTKTLQRQLEVTEGSSITIECEVTDKDTPVVTWYQVKNCSQTDYSLLPLQILLMSGDTLKTFLNKIFSIFFHVLLGLNFWFGGFYKTLLLIVLKDEEPITPDEHFVTEFEHGVCRLTIHNVYLEDEAEYKCEAVTSQGAVTTVTELFVESKIHQFISQCALLQLLCTTLTISLSSFWFSNFSQAMKYPIY